MAFEAGPDGFGHRLRPVERRDASHIFALRKDPELGRFLNPVAGGLEDQERWIEAQQALADDYYFVIETAGAARWEGVVGLYGIDDAEGEWGRWILRRGSLAALPSLLLVLRFGFEQLGLNRIYCRTLASNTMGISFQDSCAYTSRSECTDKGGRAMIEHSLEIADWPAFRDRLIPMAERIGRRGMGSR